MPAAPIFRVVVVALCWWTVVADRRSVLLSNLLVQDTGAVSLVQRGVVPVGGGVAAPVAQVVARSESTIAEVTEHISGIGGGNNITGLQNATGLMQEQVAFATEVQRTSSKLWRTKKNPGSALYFVLPIFGFIVTLAAIFATIVLEKGISDNANAPLAKKIGSEMRLLHHPGQRLPMFSAPGAGRGAEQLLRGPVLPPPDPYQQPMLNTPLAMAPPPPPVTPGVAPGGSGPELQVVIPWVPPGGALGINMADDDLSITGFATHEARGFGFLIGDKIMHLNGVPVFEQDDFLFHFKAARDRNIALGEPLIFNIWRPPHHHRHSHFREEPAQMFGDRSSWAGIWEYEDQVAGNGRHRYRIAPDVDGLRFEQKLPDGDLVMGILTPCSDKFMECKLARQSGDVYGMVRLRPGGRDSLISNLTKSGDQEFGPDILAHRTRQKSHLKSRWVC